MKYTINIPYGADKKDDGGASTSSASAPSAVEPVETASIKKEKKTNGALSAPY